MSEMVERVARAILKTCRLGMIGDDSIVNPEEVARAAIAAMREPTEAMIAAGFSHAADPCWPEDLGRAYCAMVDAALAEPK